MKKILFTSVFVVLTLFFCVFSVYFAYAENQERILTTNTQLTETTSRILSILEENSLENDSVATLARTTDNYTISTKENTNSNQTFYNVKSENYSLNYTSDTLELVNIFNIANNFANVGTANETTARAFITNLYEELALPIDYELTYLVKMDDSLWEADFSKKYGDIYNKYESVKIFFSPDTQEIAALTIFNEKAEESSTLVRTTSLTADNAKNVAITNLNITDDKILDVYQGFERANGFYSNEELDLSKKVYNVWIVKYLTENTTATCYIDINSGDIIGGAIQK